MSKVIVKIDGASRGNPGRAAIGVVVRDELGQTISTVSEPIGICTNNQAEYSALIRALEIVAGLPPQAVEVYSDSELLVRQVMGQYKVRRSTLVPLYQNAMHLIASLKSFTIFHVRRESNTEADRLANAALNRTN